MIFIDPIYPFFLVASLVVYWKMTTETVRKYWLLLISSVFYGAWDLRFLALLYFTVAVDYALAKKIDSESLPQKRKRWVVASVVMNLTMLSAFKYFNFFTASVSYFLKVFGVGVSLPPLTLLLPIGISFYTFQSLSYVIDVYRGEMRASSFVDVLTFIIFFPQLVAGPIVRAGDFLPQLGPLKSIRNVAFRNCIFLLILGYFKKAVIGDNFAAVTDPVFARPQWYGSSTCVLAAVGYWIQIYCDFSGYTDMAVGTAGLFGYSLCDNFKAPLLSCSIRDFWRRWHISLSTWLRDYLFNPLGGIRGGAMMAYRNIFITMVLGGLWHGASLNFVLWGASNGVALISHSYWSVWNRRHLKWKIPPLVGWLVTQSFLCVNAVLFRCADLSLFRKWAAQVLMNRQGLAPSLGNGWWLLVGSLLLAHYLWNRRGVACNPFSKELNLRVMPESFYRFPPEGVFAVMGVAIMACLFFIPLSLNPFIYFQF